MTTTLRTTFAAAAASAALAACSLAPTYEAPQVAIPSSFAHAAAAPEAPSIQAAAMGWQDYFADPRLHRLIELALARNTDLRQAALNAEAVQKQYAIARAELFPGVDASASGSRARVARDLSATGQPFVSSSYSVGVGIASYELDLFGRVRNAADAALQGYFASAAARDATHLALVAAVAKSYFGERYADEAMALAQRVLATREQTYALARRRYRAGVASAIDLRQQEALIEAARADYAAAVQAKEQAANVLVLLINQPLPAGLPAPLPLAEQFKIDRLPAGLPSEVLLNRPDIRAAEFALRAANANIGAARAAFFPRIGLTASIGTGSDELGHLFKGGNRTWAFAPAISVPIFHWGALSASLDAAKIRQQEQVAAYEGAVQSAFRDVADALVAREQLDARRSATVRQSAAQAEALRLVRLRYKHGASSMLDLLDAERSSYSTDLALLAIENTRLGNLADLYKALGGGLRRHSSDDLPFINGQLSGDYPIADAPIATGGASVPAATPEELRIREEQPVQVLPPPKLP